MTLSWSDPESPESPWERPDQGGRGAVGSRGRSMGPIHAWGLGATVGWMDRIYGFRKRELFAYSCEAYSRLRELGRTKAERAALLEEHARCPMAIDGDDADEYIDILREAVGARNGFKRILKRCAPPPRRSRALAAQLVPR